MPSGRKGGVTGGAVRPARGEAGQKPEEFQLRDGEFDGQAAGMPDATRPIGLPSGFDTGPFQADDADAVAAVRDAVRVVEPQAWMPGPDCQGIGAGDQFNVI